MSNETILKIDHMEVNYGELLAVRDVTFSVKRGQIVSIIGVNGAGKSTVLKAIAGLLSPSRGTIKFMGEDITGHKPFKTVAKGISLVPEGRHIFPRLTVRENLLIGSYTPKARNQSENSCKKIFSLFPILKERADQLGTNLSGGEQQMLAIGRALMSNPQLILFDEISLGLSPLIIRDIYEKVKEINDEGITVVLVEQDIKRSLKASEWTYVLAEGRVVLQGRPERLTETQIRNAYFGAQTIKLP